MSTKEKQTEQPKAKESDDDDTQNIAHDMKKRNIMSIILSTVLCASLIIIYFSKFKKPFKQMKRGDWKAFWTILRYLSRFILFSLCIVSYLWIPTPNKETKNDVSDNNGKAVVSQNRISKIFAMSDNAFTEFLQIAFKSYWPLNNNNTSSNDFNTERVIRLIALIMIPSFSVLKHYTKLTQKGFETVNYFKTMKFIRKMTRTIAFPIGVYFGQSFLNRTVTYKENINYFVQRPWLKYRNPSLFVNNAKNRKTVTKIAKYVVFAMIFACLIESFLLEYIGLIKAMRKNNSVSNSNDDTTTTTPIPIVTIIPLQKSDYYEIGFKFLTSDWKSVLLPLFVYPIELLCLLIGLMISNLGKNIIRGLVSYCLLISGHTSLMTILSLIIVWEIERFGSDLNKNLFKAFTQFNADSDGNDNDDCKSEKSLKRIAMKRLHVFDSLCIVKRQELIPILTFLFHFIIIDRIIYVLFDFWNFQCDARLDFDILAFSTRHLFQLVLTMWVMLKMAKFNRKWPSELIQTVRRFRLQNWIQSADQFELYQSSSSSPLLAQSLLVGLANSVGGGSSGEIKIGNDSNNWNEFYDKEFELWMQYLSEPSFVRTFGFRLFGYHIDIRWFTMSFILQFTFILYGMAGHFDAIDSLIC